MKSGARCTRESVLANRVSLPKPSPRAGKNLGPFLKATFNTTLLLHGNFSLVTPQRTSADNYSLGTTEANWSGNVRPSVGAPIDRPPKSGSGRSLRFRFRTR